MVAKQETPPQTPTQVSKCPFAGKGFNITSPEVLANQIKTGDEMLKKCPVASNGKGKGVTVFKHADVLEVINDADSYISKSNHTSVPHGLDGTNHRLAREAIAGAFTDEKMLPLFPKYRKIATDLVSEMLKETGTVDGQQFAFLYSARVQLTLLNWDLAFDKTCIEWTKANIKATSDNDRPKCRENARVWNELVAEQLNKRRSRRAMGLHKNLPDDATDDLLNARVNGEPMTDEEIASLLRNLNMGLVSSLACNIGNSIDYLSEHQDLQEQVRSNMSLLPEALDEITRITGCLVMCKRTTACPVKLGGVDISAGEQVVVNWLSANRDPSVFEEPEKFKWGRDHSKNLMYGAGPHECMGIQLARRMLEIAFEELLNNTTQIVPDRNVIKTVLSYPANGFLHLPIRINNDRHVRKQQEQQFMMTNLLEKHLFPIKRQQFELQRQLQDFKNQQIDEHKDIERTFQNYSSINYAVLGSVLGITFSILLHS
eukprot:Pgem_evm1s190